MRPAATSLKNRYFIILFTLFLVLLTPRTASARSQQYLLDDVSYAWAESVDKSISGCGI